MSFATKLGAFRQLARFDNRWQLLLQRTLFRHDAIGVYRLGPLQFLVDHTAGDPSGAPEVITSRMYVDHLAHLRTPTPATVLDLGANAGGFPLFLAYHGVPLQRVVSVELNPRTCIRLRYNLERNLSCEVTVVNAALCGAARTFDLPLGEGGVGDSLYAPSFNNAGQLRRVEGATFDTLFDTHYAGQVVDICKMDVEFAEYEVFDNPGHDRLRQCRVLVVEIHDKPGRSHRDVADAIVALGFDEQPLGSDPNVYVFSNRHLARVAGGHAPPSA